MLRQLIRLSLFAIVTATLATPQKPVTIAAVAAKAPEDDSDGGNITWTPDGKRFAFTKGDKLMIYTAATQATAVLADLNALEDMATEMPDLTGPFEWENRHVTEQKMQWAEDGKRFLYTYEGDIFFFDGKWGQLTATSANERDARLSPDAKKVAFRRGNDLYVIDIATRKETRLTSDSTPTRWNGRLDWVYPEELEIGRAFWWSPDSASIAYLQFDISKQQIYPHNDLVTNLRALAEPQRYPKAGSPNASVKLGVISAGGGATMWMEVGETTEKLLARIDWTPDSKQIFVQRLNRIQNHLELLSFNAASGEPRKVLEERDWAWINLNNLFRFLPKSNSFLWGSERDGFRHIYRYRMNGDLEKRLTGGEWEVTEVNGVDEQNGILYFTSTAESPLERHLYRIPLQGGVPLKLTKSGGTHDVSMNPNTEFYLDTHSNLQSPERRTLHDREGKELAVYKEADKKFSEYTILPTEIVKVKAENGDVLYARLIKPAGFIASKKYPAIVVVYGGPTAQSIRDRFTGLSWEQALANKGFVIWQLDNHGSAGRGHKFESPVFRRLGEQELSDQTRGVEHLVSMGFVDKTRIGIYGWSYGGFMSLYSLMNAPKLFKAGIAGAPVTDWRNYDTIYTERYMDIPKENPAGYRYSSPVNLAENLEAKLLIVHNMEDDNVLFQNSMQMMNALQLAGKPFETMIYPQKAHAVTGEARKHMLEAMTSFFERTLR